MRKAMSILRTFKISLKEKELKEKKYLFIKTVVTVNGRLS